MKSNRTTPAAARVSLALGALVLAGCVSSTPPQPAKLAADPGRPELALFEHVLTAHFAGQGSGPASPTTCARLRPDPLRADQEEALMSRFIRLAPASRCRAQGGGQVDAVTGQPAGLVEVYQFSCVDDAGCTGWASMPGRPATRYAMRWDNGAWRFTSDAQLLAE